MLYSSRKEVSALKCEQRLQGRFAVPVGITPSIKKFVMFRKPLLLISP